MEPVSRQLDRAVRHAIHAAFQIDADPLITPSQNEKFGDYQSNAAMGLVKRLQQKTNPQAVAKQIVEKLDLGGISDQPPTIAGPGFINVTLSPRWLAGQLRTIASDQRLGVQPAAHPQRVVVDYAHPNIAKELHVGHIRTTIIGDAIARVLMFCGDTVIRQNHIGDWGTQFGKVILAIWSLAMAERRGNLGRIYDAAQQLLEADVRNDTGKRRAILTDLAERHQRNLDEDPTGEKYFAPFLDTYRPDLAQLEPLYRIINIIEDAPEAKELMIRDPRRGTTRSLAEQSKLITGFLQRYDDPMNRQEYRAWELVREATMRQMQTIYDRMGVLLKREDECGESRFNPALPGVVSELRAKGLAVDSQGAVAVFIDGPDKPPAIIEKSGGDGYLYATTDLAALRHRIEKLKADRIIYVVDSRQTLHLRQLFAIGRAAGWVPQHVQLEHAVFGTMLGKDGKPFKTRSGEVLSLADFLDEAEERALAVVSEKNPELPEQRRRQIAHAVGIGALKYADLSKDRTSDYLFDWDQMLSFDGNTAPYLQYAYARIRSIFRKAGVDHASATQYESLALAEPQELALAKHIVRLGEVIESLARDLKPHVLCNYLYELATRFSAFFENCPVIQSPEPTRSSRLALCDLTARTLACGLELLGIEHPEQM
jgi:arginyl-tRNA synthetase